MDNLVLTRVADDLDRALRKAFLREIRQEGPFRYRCMFEKGERRLSAIISLRPELPWIGRPVRRWEGSRRPPGPFASLASRTLRGNMVHSLTKPTVDRVVFLEFVTGESLVAELATHGANLILLDRAGKVVSTVRFPKAARERLEVGSVYLPPSLPSGKFNPFGADPVEIEKFLEKMADKGEEPFEALRRHAFGIGSMGARLIVREAGRGEMGIVTRNRLDAVRDGDLDPVIRAAGDPMSLSAEGRFDHTACELLPWEPPEGPGPGMELIKRIGPSATAGLYHEAEEQAAWLRDRIRGLSSVLVRESGRLENLRLKVENDVRAFSDPDRYRIWGEAILAGLRNARRTGETVFVIDPYDAGESLMEVPAPGGKPLPVVAEGYFKRYRRAVRGLQAARGRAGKVMRRRDVLEEMLQRVESVAGVDGIRALEEEMRGAGIPVGLESGGKKARGHTGDPKPRLEGVRLVEGRSGTILVGRGGRNNDRLTFKLASPEDFWFHALGVPGAHVLVRNPDRKKHPSRKTLLEAAAVAAWYSDAREQKGAEVQWTRRKYVRRVRGGAPGRVIIKRFETVRVRPALPDDLDRE